MAKKTKNDLLRDIQILKKNLEVERIKHGEAEADNIKLFAICDKKSAPPEFKAIEPPAFINKARILKSLDEIKEDVRCKHMLNYIKSLRLYIKFHTG